MKGFPKGTLILPLDYPHPMSGDLTAERLWNHKRHWYVIARCRCGRLSKVGKSIWENPKTNEHPRPTKCRECARKVPRTWNKRIEGGGGTRETRAAEAAKRAPVIIRDAAHARELIQSGELPTVKK